jgi:hypothetical protein
MLLDARREAVDVWRRRLNFSSSYRDFLAWLGWLRLLAVHATMIGNLKDAFSQGPSSKFIQAAAG